MNQPHEQIVQFGIRNVGQAQPHQIDGGNGNRQVVVQRVGGEQLPPVPASKVTGSFFDFAQPASSSSGLRSSKTCRYLVLLHAHVGHCVN